MATIKSSFHVRKSSRLYTKGLEGKVVGEKAAITVHSSSDSESASGQQSPGRAQSSALLYRDGISTSSSVSSKSSSSPQTPATPKYVTPVSLSRNSSAHFVPGISLDDLTMVCKRLLSPSKRTSDNESGCSRDSLSPVKSFQASMAIAKRKTGDENDCSSDSLSPVKSCRTPLALVKRKSDDENDCSSDSISPVKLCRAPPAFVKRKSDNESGCSSDSLSPVTSCRASPAPAKRKSDDENDSCKDYLSPMKSRKASSVNISLMKSSLLAAGYISPRISCQSPVAAGIETPKSSRRPTLAKSLVSTSTPRRLFDSPSKTDFKSNDETPIKQTLDTTGGTPVGLSTPGRPRSAAKPYLTAKRCLHTAKPDRLIGRDNESAELEDFICDKLDNDVSGSLYISGAPGTGKTVVVNHVIEKLKNEYGRLRTAYINCMTLKDSSAVLQQMHEQLTGSPVKAKDAVRAVETLFTTSNESILLVLDEIDQLDSKHHHVLYRIFEWPALHKSKLVLIGIANALDLTDRVLPRLQASQKCRPTLMNFRPYSSIQITDILKHRLQRDCVVEPSAVNFCARKVSAVAGDVRKALDICRRAVEMVESESRCQQVLKPTDCNSPTKKGSADAVKTVTISHISRVMSDVYGASVNAANSSENDVPLQQKLAVCSLLVMVKNGKLKEVQLGKLHEAYTKVCRHQQMAPVDQSEFSSVLSLLDSRGVITLKKAKDTRLAKVSLKLDELELEQTLKDRVLMASILRAGIPK